MTMSAFGVVGPIYGFGLCAVIAVIYLLMPRLTRPEVYFAVTVPAAFRAQPEGLTALKRYRSWVWLHTAVAAGLVFLGFKMHREVLFSVGFVWQTLGSLQAFLSARKVVLPHASTPSTIREAALQPARPSLPGGPVAQSGPFLLLGATAGYVALHWQEIPARFPVHWDLAGHANRWINRSVPGVFGSLLTGVVLCAMMLMLSFGILHWSRRVQVTGEPGRSEQRFRGANLAILLGAEYLIAVTFAGVSLLPLLTAGPGAFPAVLMLVELAMLIGILIVLTRMGQGGTRSATAEQQGAPVGDRTSDAYWKWGIFYFNPDDPAVFVEKRFGIGYTLNFGSRRSWVVLGLIILVPVMTSLLALR
jgi:uncharacterized membrane protein